jgi:predicted AAA+ superfamily ATPase
MRTRRLTEKITEQLEQFPAVAMLGPRQVGKTTLAREVLAKGQASLYLDLERPSDQSKLSDPELYLSGHADKLVILDEVQRMPELFQVLRSLIDEDRRPGRFLLLGSASIDLLKQSGESMAGRISYVELSPFDATEVAEKDLSKLWIRGGFPESFLAKSEEQSVTWRENFIRTYLERDIPQLGPRIPAETLRRFWTMLSHLQGQLLNAAQIGKSLAIDGKTVARYLDLLVDLLLVRRLQPLQVNAGKRLVKSPKVYVRDSGLVHTLLQLDDREAMLGHPVAGLSWEGFVIENILRVAPDRTRASFYRTAAGAEVDLVLDVPGNKRIVVEVKRGLAPKPERGFYNALEDLEPDKAFVVYSGKERFPIADGIEAIGLGEAMVDAYR